MNQTIVTENYGFTHLFKSSWYVYKEKFMVILPIILIVYIPISIGLSFVNVEALSLEYGPASALRIYNLISRLTDGLIGVIAVAAIAQIIDNLAQSRTIGWADALSIGLTRWPAMIGTNILAGIILLGLTLLLILPGIIWGLYYSFIIYVVALRPASGKLALNYSKSLVEGQWWEVFGTLFAANILISLLGLVFVLPFMFLPQNQVLDIIESILLYFLQGFQIVVMVVYFLNLENQKYPPVPEITEQTPEFSDDTLNPV